MVQFEIQGLNALSRGLFLVFAFTLPLNIVTTVTDRGQQRFDTHARSGAILRRSRV